MFISFLNTCEINLVEKIKRMKNKLKVPILKIEIIGDKAKLFLVSSKKEIISGLEWTDKRDFAEKIIAKTDLLLKNNNLFISDISAFDFYCNSPYFAKNKTNEEESNLSDQKKCGFTTWQIGEITAKIFNFITKTK